MSFRIHFLDCWEVSVAWIVARWRTCVRNWNNFGRIFLLLRLANELASVCEFRALTWATLECRIESYNIVRNWITTYLLRTPLNVLPRVGIPTALRLERSGVQILIGTRNFSLPQNAQTCSGTNLASYSVCTVVKTVGAWRLPLPSGAQIKNWCSHTSAFPSCLPCVGREDLLPVRYCITPFFASLWSGLFPRYFASAKIKNACHILPIPAPMYSPSYPPDFHVLTKLGEHYSS